MTKKIPSSNLPVILISLVSLYLIFWICVILLSIFPSGVTLPGRLNIFIFFCIPACLSASIALTAFLYLRRDKPQGTPQVLAIIAATIFGLLTLQFLVMLAWNLTALFYYPNGWED